jgi:imidazolonepropionase-like amidohydrolase
VATGKQADLVAFDGNLAANIGAIRRVKLVFKDGAGYDPAKLLDSVKGSVGLHWVS